MKLLLAHNRYREPGGEDTVVDHERELLRSAGIVVTEWTRSNADLSNAQFAHALFRHRPAEKDRQQLEERMAQEQIDLVHLHNGFPLLGKAVVGASASLGIPVIQTVHNYRPTCLSANHLRDGALCFDCPAAGSFGPGVRHGCYRHSRILSAGVARQSAWQVEQLRSGRIALGLCLTEASRRLLIQAGVPPDRLVVKPNSIADLGASDGQDGDLVFVGRHSAEKGLPLLLDELERGLPIGRRVTVVGTGPHDARIARLAKSTDGQVRQAGRLTREGLMDCMGRAAVVLMPSLWYEGLPMTAIESLMLGTPVAVSERMAWPAEYPSEALVRFNPTEPGWLARLSALDYEGLRMAARSLYLRSFTDEQNVRALARLYQQVIGAKV